MKVSIVDDAEGNNPDYVTLRIQEFGETLVKAHLEPELFDDLVNYLLEHSHLLSDGIGHQNTTFADKL